MDIEALPYRPCVGLMLLNREDKITVPVAKAPALEAPKIEKVVEPTPVESLNIPAQSLASAAAVLPGVMDAPPGPPTNSLGSGRGGGEARRASGRCAKRCSRGSGRDRLRGLFIRLFEFVLIRFAGGR